MGRFTPLQVDWEFHRRRMQAAPLICRQGAVSQVIGLVIEARGPAAALGELCRLELPAGQTLPALVVGFRDDRVLLMPLDGVDGLRPGCTVTASGRPPSVGVSPGMLGRVINALGEPIDGDRPLPCVERREVTGTPPPAIKRARITRPLGTGVRAIDALLTVGYGQRIGIFAGSGVGKSTLLGMMARASAADVNVIALIGERGREVREFIERDLGEEGMARSVVVVSTSDQPALQRIHGAYTAMSVAEYFRDLGRHVLFFMDSVTRFATALREVGLAVGEPPATRGYTPSVFAALPRYLERAGAGAAAGSITGMFTILVENDDINEPIGDAVRAILDGHIVLSRDLAARNHYPAIDVLGSISRVMPDLVSEDHREAAQELRRVLAVYRDAEDLIQIGAYQRGSSAEIDDAVRRIADLRRFLIQARGERIGFDAAVAELLRLCPRPRAKTP